MIESMASSGLYENISEEDRKEARSRVQRLDVSEYKSLRESDG